MVRKSLLILLLSISLKSFSQQSINNAIEYLQRFSTEELDWENISISLQDFKEHPLRLNHLNTARFIEFPLLNQRHLASIRKYIKSNGQLYSINELTNLAYFTPDLVNVIKPFISFSIKNKPSKVRASILQKVNLQLEPNYGLLRNDSDRFTGAKSQSLSRLIIQNKTQKVGFIWEKDKGESIQNSFIKYGYQGRFTKLRYQINLGSYSLHLGEGLLHSNKFIVGKSAPISSFYKITQPLSINTSSTEDNYETGLAISSKLKSVKLMAFYSRNRLHGTYEDGTILSIKKDGLFRNQSEINKRNTGAYNLAGTSISLQTKLLILSLNSIYVNLNRPYIPAPSYYNSNYQISNCFNNSLHYRYFDGSKSIKGEVAIDKMGNLATTHFFVFPVNDDFNFLLNMRSFSKKYSSFRANTLSENSRVQNEHAVLTGFDFIGSKTKMYASMDYFAFPAPKYLVHLPSNGTEFLGYISRQLTDSIDLKLFYKYESKHQDLNTEVIDLPLKRSLHHLYARLNIHISEKLNFKSRLDFTSQFINNKRFQGFSHYLEITRKSSTSTFSGRITFFNTDNWDTRIYLYEKDILYHFSVPAFYDKGTRFYLNYNKAFTPRVKLWIKYGRTIFSDKTSIGSGNSEVLGNIKSEFRTQIQIKF